MMFAFSCNFINPEEKIPTYIKVDKLHVAVNSGQGSASNKIKDVWVFMDGNMVGVYQLPALFPVIGDEGRHSFLFSPGILDNGIDNTHVIYRLMKGETKELSLINGSTISADPVTINYFPADEFPWMEDFENQSQLSLVTSDTTNPLLYETHASELFEGVASGIISINSSHNAFRIEMFEAVTLPITSVTYLEMNYRCDYPFYVGLSGEKSTGNIDKYVVAINPSAEWNKIYVNLGDAVRSLNPALGYKVFMSSSLSEGATSGTFRFDNLKLVHN